MMSEMSDARSANRTLQFPCIRCGSLLESPSSRSGQPGKCPTCGELLTVPHVDPRTGIALEPTASRDGSAPTPLHAYAAAGANAPRIVHLDNGESAIVCPRCGRASPLTAHRCDACGLPFTMEGTGPAGRETPDALDYACLACGAVAALTIACHVGFVPAVVAIVLGVISMRRARQDRRLVRWWPVYGGIAAALGAIAFGVARAMLP
jgi:DNA-directed RNA polymerase subunit RPC12/RpoP